MFEQTTEYLPILIRIAALFIVGAVLYDYFRRKWAKLIADAVISAGAISAESAVSTARLEESKAGITRLIKLLLKHDYSPLRRYIMCVKPERETDTTTKKRKKRSDRLTGEEKWYILPPPDVNFTEDGEKAEKEAPEKEPERSTPALLRLGGEQKPLFLIIGCIFTLIFTELIIYFLPQIVRFFTDISKLGRN